MDRSNVISMAHAAFEVMSARPGLGPEAQGQVQTLAVSELESFALQTRLSSEMAYLSLFCVGMARYAVQDWDGAVARFCDALSQTTERVSVLDQSTIYIYRGIAFHNKGDYDRAIADYDQAIRLQPDCARAYNNRGVAFRNKGDYDRAIADYDQAIRLQPDDARAYYNRGIAFRNKGDYDRAIADYDQVVRLQPDFATAYYGRGLVYKLKGKYEQAIADFEQFLELSDDPYWRQQAEEQLQALRAR